MVGAVGDAARVPGFFGDVIDIGAGLGVGDGAEVDGGGVLFVRIGLGYGDARLRHSLAVRVAGLEACLERELVGIVPLAAFEHLGQTEARLGVELGGGGAKAERDSAVVAQVGMDLRCRGNARAVVPFGVEYVACGVGDVAAHSVLLGVELVDEDQACSALGEGIAFIVGGEGTLKTCDHAAIDGDDFMGVLWSAVAVAHDVLVLVVVRCAACRTPGRTLGACLVGIEGRCLLEVVVVVGVGWTEVCLRIAQGATGPLVGKEAHRVCVAVPVGVDVVGEPGDLIGCE